MGLFYSLDVGATSRVGAAGRVHLNRFQGKENILVRLVAADFV